MSSVAHERDILSKQRRRWLGAQTSRQFETVINLIIVSSEAKLLPTL